MGMYPNMFGMNPNNINLNADPSQLASMPMNGEMPGFGVPLYPGMYPGMGNPSQSNTNNQQNN